MPAREGHCRLCWRQARLLEGLALGGRPRVDPRPFFAQIQVTGQQLFFGAMWRHLQLAYPRWRYRQRHQLTSQHQPVKPVLADREWMQLRLFDVPRDYLLVDPDRGKTSTPGPFLARARQLAARRAELRGWSTDLQRRVDRGLRIVLSDHALGEQIPYSRLVPLARHRRVMVERLAEILAELGVLLDDRPDPFEAWLGPRLADLAPGIAADVAAWLRALHTGGPRRRPRSQSTAWGYLAAARPHLQEWSARYQHLREVTRDDILAVIGSLEGTDRKEVHVALRSLFGFCKRQQRIFRNPTVGIVAGAPPRRRPLPLDRDRYDEALAAAISPEQRLMLALTVVHAARRPALRHLRLDDLDLANRRITIGGHTRPLDELTHRVLLAWLAERQARFPRTANRHLFVSRHTTHETGPVSDWWCYMRFRGLSVTLEQMRIDRQLDEALAGGGDPMHLAAVFGISELTAMHYAAAARALLAGELERNFEERHQRTAARDRRPPPR